MIIELSDNRDTSLSSVVWKWIHDERIGKSIIFRHVRMTCFTQYLLIMSTMYLFDLLIDCVHIYPSFCGYRNLDCIVKAFIAVRSDS